MRARERGRVTVPINGSLHHRYGARRSPGLAWSPLCSACLPLFAVRVSVSLTRSSDSQSGARSRNANECGAHSQHLGLPLAAAVCSTPRSSPRVTMPSPSIPPRASISPWQPSFSRAPACHGTSTEKLPSVLHENGLPICLRSSSSPDWHHHGLSVCMGGGSRSTRSSLFQVLAQMGRTRT
jgi:hypothetical protein